VIKPTTFRVAGVQMEPKFAEVAINRSTMLIRVAAAATDNVRLVVFPECALTGYGFDSRDEARHCAEPVDGPTSQAMRNAIRKLDIFVIYGFLEADGDRLYNACVLVGPRGVVGSYRKVHLPHLGVDRWVNPGDRPFAVHDAGGVKVGMHICYDGSFPETGRVLSLLGADLLVLPTNWPTHSETAAEHMIATRALENTVYAMAVNRVGEERGFRYIGRSSIAAPDGQVIAFAGAAREQVITAEIDPAKARQKRLIRVPGLHEIDRFADRRPGFYGPIVEPNGRE
jgi:predicted amidohydrolase